MEQQAKKTYTRPTLAVVVGAFLIAATLMTSTYLGHSAGQSTDVITTTQLDTIISTVTHTETLTSIVNNTSTVTTTSLVATTQTETVTVTNTVSTDSNDTFLTQCTVTGIGNLEFRVMSDSNGTSVSGEIITAIDRLGCDIAGQSSETQTVYLNNFTSGAGGWLTPVWPNQAQPGGQLTFTIKYQGVTYNFVEEVPPMGTICATLHVPSGNVTTSTVVNGSGSNCP